MFFVCLFVFVFLFFLVFLGPHRQLIEFPWLGPIPGPPNLNAWNPLHSIGMLWAMLQKIHCNQSGCIGPRCMDSTAYNRDPLCHNAWNPLHSMMLHGIHCIPSGCILPHCMEYTAFNHNGWNPMHSIGMLWAMLQKIHCIQS